MTTPNSIPMTWSPVGPCEVALLDRTNRYVVTPTPGGTRLLHIVGDSIRDEDPPDTRVTDMGTFGEAGAAKDAAERHAARLLG